MDRDELIVELNRISIFGIVNAHHDTEVLKEAIKQLNESDLDAFKRILLNCKNMRGKWDVHEDENEDGKPIFDVTIRDFSDSVTLCFDENGRLMA